MIGSQIISSISSIDPAIIEAATKGLATVIGKVAGEKVLKSLGKGGEKILDGTGNLTQEFINFFSPISRKYIENYIERHGTLKVLGMPEGVPLDSVYTKVNFRDETISNYLSISDVEKIFRDRECHDQEKRIALEVANEKQYLMVLGHPGSGKTTFLRKVGLEALKGQKGEYSHSCIPVLLELRKFKKTGEIDLIQAIAEEFKNCSLPKYEECAEEFLSKGKLLILFDGLDEVPNDILPEMTEQIRNLLDQYADNRFIASCRFKAYHNFDSFRRFTDVSIADFDEEQVKTFIDKWFESHNQAEWGEQCWEKLSSGNDQGTKELTKTPLLLTLICILFKKTGQFPQNRATLYERTLRVLLEEWDASKQIPRAMLYQGLDTKRKELMLAQVAYENFVEDDLFFTGRAVSKQIEEALGEMLPDERYIDGRKVLREVEAQHGVIIERQEDTYSFSHLTLQEYLTALHIYETDEINIEELINNHFFDKRWREVFLILAGLKKADNLLLAMEKSIHSLINTPNLQNLLLWVEKVTDQSSGDVQPVGKKAISLANAYSIALKQSNPIGIANNYNFALNFVFTNNYAYILAFKHANTIALAIALSNTSTCPFALHVAIANAYTHILILENVNALAYDYADRAIEKFIYYSQWSNQYQIYQGIDFDNMITILKKFKTEIPEEEGQASRDIYNVFAQRLIDFWLESFDLTPEMVNLSKEEIKALDNYFYGNWLMVQCKDAAVRYSPKVWQEIESRMLLPQ
jgi:energy-coupling factor transporter ATP-binding protein EcfA2